MKNDYDADDDTRFDAAEPNPARSMTVVTIVLLVVAGFFTFAWYAYRSNSPAGGDAVEVVHADAGPVKEKPKDPGGMNIPYQDMSVYNVISEHGEKKEERRVEKLLPEPEEPIAKRDDTDAPAAAAPAAGRKEEPNVFIKGETPTIDGPKPAPAAGSVKPADAAAHEDTLQTASSDTGKPPASTPAAKEETPKEAAVAPAAATASPSFPAADAKAPVTVAKPVKKDAAAALATGNVQIQLAALKSTEEAEKTWNQVKARFPTALGGKPHNIVKAELPSGTFYRLRTSGFSTEAAKKLCSDLAARKQPCMIVH